MWLNLVTLGSKPLLHPGIRENIQALPTVSRRGVGEFQGILALILVVCVFTPPMLQVGLFRSTTDASGKLWMVGCT